MVVTMTVAVVTVVAAVAMADVMMVVVVVSSVPRFLVEIDHGDALPYNHGVGRWPPDDYRWLGG
jgi:hypothetical protein